MKSSKKKSPNQEQAIFFITLLLGLAMLKYPIQAFFQGHWYAAAFYSLSAAMIIPWTRQSIEKSFHTKLLSLGYIFVVVIFFVLGFIYSIL